MMHTEGINHGNRRGEFLPGGSHDVVPMAHAVAFVYVLVCKVEVTDNDSCRYSTLQPSVRPFQTGG